MSAQPKDIDEAKEPREATGADLLSLWQPRSKRVTVTNPDTGEKFSVRVRSLTIEERARTERLEDPTNHDAMACVLAMGCVDKDGKPAFGPYAEALEKMRRVDPQLAIDVAVEIFKLSGMSPGATENAKGN